MKSAKHCRKGERQGAIDSEQMEEKNKVMKMEETQKEEVVKLNTTACGMVSVIMELTEHNYRMVKNNEIAEDKVANLITQKETLALEKEGLVRTIKSRIVDLETLAYLIGKLYEEKGMTNLCEEESMVLY